MKKTLAVLLALTMLFALCVPAFAVDNTITETGAQTGDGKVVVAGQDVAESFSVSFPAQCDIAWNDTTTVVDMGYTVNSYVLKVGRQLTVSVTADGVMKSADAAKNPKTLQLVNEGASAFSVPQAKAFVGASLSTEPAYHAADMKYHVQSFDGMPLDEYTATFTYTVDCGATA